MLDDAVEEKDGGEKVRLGMVVCQTWCGCLHVWGCIADLALGYSREFGSDAGSTGEDRRGSGPEIERTLNLGGKAWLIGFWGVRTQLRFKGVGPG